MYLLACLSRSVGQITVSARSLCFFLAFDGFSNLAIRLGYKPMEKRRVGLQDFEVFPGGKSPTAQDEINPLHNLSVDQEPQCVPDGLFLNGGFYYMCSNR